MGEVSKPDFAKLVMTISKASENMPDDFDGKAKSKLLDLETTVSKLDAETLSQNNYNKLLAAAGKFLKQVIAANKSAKKSSTKDETWTISGYVDDDVCDNAAKNAIPGVEKAYKKKRQELLDYAISEKNLGVLYEKNLLTKGDKYSLFFKYVRKKDKVAQLVCIAIGCHDGKGYVRLNKDGKPTKTKISAQKKNL